MEEIKKEAERIIDLFKFERGYGICEDTGIKGIDESQAKQCAISCVDEKLLELNRLPLPNLMTVGNRTNSATRIRILIKFWEKVKQYIIDNY